MKVFVRTLLCAVMFGLFEVSGAFMKTPAWPLNISTASLPEETVWIQ